MPDFNNTFCLISWDGKKYDFETFSIDRVLSKERFLWKNHAENVHQELVSEHFLILINNPKQLLHARNWFKNSLHILQEDYQNA